MKRFLICLLISSQGLCFCDDTKSKEIEVQKFQQIKKFNVFKKDLKLSKDKVQKAAIQLEKENERKQQKTSNDLEEKENSFHKNLRKQDIKVVENNIKNKWPAKSKQNKETKSAKS